MADERNPFTLGPTAGRTRYKPDLATRTPAYRKPQAPEVSGSDIVNSLLAFSGVAADEYTKRVAKKVEEDKAVQISRALEGALPTDEATVAGYRAHVAVSIKGKVLEGQARLNQLAKERITDDQWNEAVREEYRNLDTYLYNTYSRFSKDKDLQMLASTAYREAIPQATAERLANKLNYEITDRVNSGTDVLVNAAAMGGLTQDDPSVVASQVNDMLESMKLTPSQADQALEQAIVNTQDLDLIRVSKEFFGSRKTSLYDRSGKIQKAEQKALTKKAADDMIDVQLKLNSLSNEFLGDGVNPGSITENEMLSAARRMREESGNRYPSGEWVASLLKQKDRKTANSNIILGGLQDFANENVTNLDHLNTEQKQDVIKYSLQTEMQAALDAADKANLQGNEKEKFLADSVKRVEQHIGDNTVEKNVLYDQWVKDFKSVANANVLSISELSQTSQGEMRQQLSDKAKKTFSTLDNLSDTARRVYLEKVGGTAKSILERYLNFKDIGRPSAEALRLAQIQERMNIRPKNEDVVAAVDTAFDASKSWFKWDTDISGGQAPWFRQRILEKVNTYPDPTSEPMQTSINNWIQTGWTRTDGGLMLEGSPEQIRYLTHVHPEAFDSAFSYYIGENSKTISRSLQGLGLTFKQVFPVINRKDGTVMVWSSFGPILGT